VLGDVIQRALAQVGVTEERVTRLLGRPCGCGERQDVLNSLERWARRVLAGRVEYAREYLRRIVGEEEL
jgi:hypothetical protein